MKKSFLSISLLLTLFLTLGFVSCSSSDDDDDDSGPVKKVYSDGSYIITETFNDETNGNKKVVT